MFVFEPRRDQALSSRRLIINQGAGLPRRSARRWSAGVLLCAAPVGLTWRGSASGVNSSLVAILEPISSAPPSPVGSTITVNSTDDVTDPNDGKCTLREAVTAANSNAPAPPAA